MLKADGGESREYLIGVGLAVVCSTTLVGFDRDGDVMPTIPFLSGGLIMTYGF